MRNLNMTKDKMKKKKHVFRNIVLLLLAVILLYFGLIFVKKTFGRLNAKKVGNDILNVNKEKTSYVFIEINPSLLITLKNNIVMNVACLNSDCISIYDELDIKNKNINDSIEIIYNKSKEKGFDTSNGVKVKSTDKLDINLNEYITIEYIDTEIESKLLNKVINNESIKTIDNQNYYANLWEKLKNDSAYGKIYECEMNGEKLSCYFKKDFFQKPDTTSIPELYRLFVEFNNALRNTFDKFGIIYDDTTKIIDIDDLKLKINYDGHELIFNIGIDGSCDANLVKADDSYYNWGYNGIVTDNDIYSFTLYKSQYALDLLHPNDVVSSMMIEEENSIEYTQIAKLNLIDPEKYPLIITDELEVIGFVERQLCNLHTSTCNHLVYLDYRITGVDNGEGGLSFSTDGVNYKEIDKVTYDKYVEYSNGYEGGGPTLDRINSTDWLAEIRVGNNTYHFRCNDTELTKEGCIRITKSEFDFLNELAEKATEYDGKYYIEYSNFVGNEYIEDRCEVDIINLKKINCKRLHYNYTKIDDNTYSYDFKYEE